MAKIAVIGGSGHVGTYLVPRLVKAGHRVINVTRGLKGPYRPDGAWAEVEAVVIDRETAEADGSFGRQIAALDADIVIDMIAFTLASTKHLVEALRGRVAHFLHCGTIWVYGANGEIPATEDQPLNGFGAYGSAKAEIETWLLAEARRTGFPATVFRPGHIVGPGWAPLNPLGHFNPQVFAHIAAGRELIIPNFGLETVHHVHADDVAQIVVRAIAARGAAVGEAFNAVSPAAVNLKGYASHMFRFFGHIPRISFMPYETWRQGRDPAEAEATWEHIVRSPCHAIDKARTRLGYQPRYSSFEAIEEAVRWLIAAGEIDPGPAFAAK